jgi:small subunit ribosomal protein S5
LASDQDLDDRVVYINRVAKTATGSSILSFSTMVAVGDRDGRVGIGIGKDQEVPDSIHKARDIAEENMMDVPRIGTTIPHEIETEFNSARVLLKPASPGTGVIAGGAVRAVIELAGIKDILTKSLGSDNPLNIARATLQALEEMKDPHKVAQLRDIPVEDLLARNPFGGPEEVIEEQVEQEDENGSESSDEASDEDASADEGAESAEEDEEAETVETT